MFVCMEFDADNDKNVKDDENRILFFPEIGFFHKLLVYKTGTKLNKTRVSYQIGGNHFYIIFFPLILIFFLKTYKNFLFFLADKIH